MYSHSLQKILKYGKVKSSSNVHFGEMATQRNTRQLFKKKKKIYYTLKLSDLQGIFLG